MLQTILAIASGGAVGFTLGLIGGGGSILATLNRAGFSGGHFV